MTQEEKIREIFKDSGGIVRAGSLRQLGVHSIYLTRMCKAGKVSRIRRGIYEWVEDGAKTDIEIISQVLPEAILCLHSALAYYGYIDRTPAIWHVAMDKNRSRWRAKINYPPVKAHYVATHIYDLGRSRCEIDGTQIWIYDRERTLCDTLKHANRLDPEIVRQAIRSYINDGEHNVSLLKEYARRLRVQHAVQSLIGVWL